MSKYICETCKKSFKHERDLDDHVDIHTPYWVKGKKVRLSGADQIRVMLAKWAGGWDKFLKDEKKRIKTKGDYDYNKAIKLQEFEQQNKIQFVVCDSNVESYRVLRGKRN